MAGLVGCVSLLLVFPFLILIIGWMFVDPWAAPVVLFLLAFFWQCVRSWRKGHPRRMSTDAPPNWRDIA